MRWCTLWKVHHALLVVTFHDLKYYYFVRPSNETNEIAIILHHNSPIVGSAADRGEWTPFTCLPLMDLHSVSIRHGSNQLQPHKKNPQRKAQEEFNPFPQRPIYSLFFNRLLCLNCALSRLIHGAEYPRHDSYSQLTISCQNKRCDRTCQKGNWLQQKLTPWLTYTQKNSVNINDSCAKQNTQVGMCIIKIIKWSI